jgi:predicted ATPase/class 3 adenylate cyclase
VPRDLPTGVVTLLFTDVEGSTKLLHELGDGYAPALHEHRRLLRAAFDDHGGVEVDTQGDAFFVAFARASDAVAAAEEAQRALHTGPIAVRMGLHTGEPRLTDGGYVGLDVHKGARIAAAGHGGQVLLSEPTHALVDAPVRDLGRHRLKDLSAPERIFQLELADLPSDFPLLKTLDVGMVNLPSPRTSFVGRNDELEAIDRLLEDPDCRLLTLVGPGGVGKTRLALEAAGRRLDRYAHGVHFVPLASVASPEFLAPSMAEALQFSVDSAHSGFSALDQLLDYLSERSTLLVLDNFEHLVGGSSLLTQVVERAPQVELLTTSRERLGVQSEWVFDVDGLPITSNGNGNGDAGGALRLFVERAQQVDRKFALEDAEGEHARRICWLVDGMPLGIELAAAWVSVLSCAEIADEIEQNIGFLETSASDVPERHRSLRAAFDQSWRLLTDEQRQTLARLSTFRGSFSREAAGTIAQANLQLLFELVGKSLVRRLELGRYELHELLRQYAAEKLAASPGALQESSERHARYYLGMVEERSDALLGERMADARDELRVEIDNIRAAAEWAVTHWAEDDIRPAFAALCNFYFAHGEHDGAEMFEHLARLVRPGSDADSEEPSRLLLSILALQTSAASWLGYDELVEQAAHTRLLPRLREVDLQFELNECLYALGVFATYRDAYPEAAAYLEEAVEGCRATGQRLTTVGGLCWLGFVRLLQDDLAAARAAFEESEDVANELGNPLARAYAQSKLGLLADAEGDYTQAIRTHLDAHELFAGVGDRGGAGYTLTRAGVSAYCLGDYEEAMRLGRAGYEAFSEANHRWGVTTALCRLGFAAAALGEFAEAQADLGRALEQARASQAQSLAELALSGIGVLLACEGDERRAVLVLSYVHYHSGLPPSYLLASQPELDRLEAELSPDELSAAREAAAAASLDDLADSLQLGATT